MLILLSFLLRKIFNLFYWYLKEDIIMAVSFDIYEVLNAVKLIVIMVFVYFLFERIGETYNKVIRLITSSILVIINIFQLLMNIHFDRPYIFTIFAIISFFITALMAAYQLAATDTHLVKTQKNSGKT